MESVTFNANIESWDGWLGDCTGGIVHKNELTD